MRKHDKGPFSCPKCPRVLKSEHGLAYHMNIHNGVAAFLCNDCGRSFVTKQKMQNHVRAKHTHERPYICDQCGAGFIRSDKMLIHKRRVHTGERPYACEHCEWRGVDSSALIHHRKKHLKALDKKMKEAASNLEFEEAGKIRDEIRKLESTELEITLNPKIRQYDVKNKLYPKGRSTMGMPGTKVTKKRDKKWKHGK